MPLIKGIRLTITRDYKELSRNAAQIILSEAKAKPALNLLVPTGSTPKGAYAILRKHPKLLKHASFFNMDEYASQNSLISPNHPASYRRYMQEHLFSGVTAKSFFPTMQNKECPGAYDALIQEKGGLDLCLVAVGEDGHIFGFNFPGSSFKSKTRFVRITPGTREVNKRLTGIRTPPYAVTTGIQTGMQARKVIFIVSGKRKARILKKILSSRISARIPATILKKHKNCEWICDREAAGFLP